MKETHKKVLSFTAVGGSVFAGVQAMLYVLVQVCYWNMHVASIVVLSASVWVNYYLNKRFTWGYLTHDSGSGRRFVTARAGTLLLSSGIANALMLAQMHYQMAAAVGIVMGTAVNYIVSDRWVFGVSTGRRGREQIAHLTTFLALSIGGVIAMWVYMPGLLLPVLMVLLAMLAMAVASMHLIALLYVHRHQDSRQPIPPQPWNGQYGERFAVLMPARHEVTLFGQTMVNAVCTQRAHPNHTFFAVVCDDDMDTIRVALAAAEVVHQTAATTYVRMYEAFARRRESMVLNGLPLTDDERSRLDALRADNAVLQVIVYPLGQDSPSKPKQMNHVFSLVKDEGFTAFTIIDAESMVQTGLFEYVDRVFQANPEVTVVQGAVQLMDPTYRGNWWQRFVSWCQRWYSWHNLLEYHRWYSGQMSFQSDNEFVPLGGNTVFVRSDALRQAGGWPLTLTEDCALGVRLSIMGGKVFTFYDPALATREETPPRASDLLKQRTRWTQGFIQSLVAGEWRTLPTRRQRLLAFWVLSNPLFQALSAPLLPLAVVLMMTGVLKSPPLLVLIMFLPLLSSLMVVALQIKQAHEYGKTYQRRVAWYVYVQMLATQLPYQLLLSFAAFRAVVRHLRGQVNWQSPARAGDLLPAPAYD